MPNSTSSNRRQAKRPAGSRPVQKKKRPASSSGQRPSSSAKKRKPASQRPDSYETRKAQVNQQRKRRPSSSSSAKKRTDSQQRNTSGQRRPASSQRRPASSQRRPSSQQRRPAQGTRTRPQNPQRPQNQQRPVQYSAPVQVVEDEPIDTSQIVLRPVEKRRRRNRPVQKKEKPQKKSNPFLRFLVALIPIVLVGGVLFGLYKYKTDLQPVGDGSKEITIEIESGQSYDSVLQMLYEKGLIRDVNTAKLYTKLFGSGQYYAGTFKLNNGMTCEQVLGYIGNQNNAIIDTIVITFPEGKWAKETAEILAENFPYKAEEFIELWNDPEYIKELAENYPFINPDELNNSEYHVKLEGYLFPETYQFYTNASMDEITRTFLTQFNNVYQEYQDYFDKSQYTVHELVTLASVVQFEAGNYNDMRKIAGVFYNRLDQDMMLQSSVTVCYALYDEFDDPEDCETNAEIDSPYNTYMNTGLPIGPILNPGEDALVAVLQPDNNEYLFFVADIYNKKDGLVHYSKTYEEHQQMMVELGLVMDDGSGTTETVGEGDGSEEGTTEE